jgi:hypothetical protein
MITIMLAGQGRVGKTTTANYLATMAKKNDLHPVILPFAKPIKMAAENAGLHKDSDPEGYRAYCQDVGESKRKENPDYWLNQWHFEWQKLVEKDSNAAQDMDKLWKETVVIADDCRYLNELNLGKKINAVTVFISPGLRQIPEKDAAWRQHESEDMANQFEAGNKDYLDIFDWIIRNDGSISTLQDKIKSRHLDWFNLSPESYIDCDCAICDKTRKDLPLTLDDLFS